MILVTGRNLRLVLVIMFLLVYQIKPSLLPPLFFSVVIDNIASYRNTL